MSLPLTRLDLSPEVVIPPWGSWPSSSQGLLALEGLGCRLSAAASACCPFHIRCSSSRFWGAGDNYRHQFLELDQNVENENTAVGGWGHCRGRLGSQAQGAQQPMLSAHYSSPSSFKGHWGWEPSSVPHSYNTNLSLPHPLLSEPIPVSVSVPCLSLNMSLSWSLSLCFSLHVPLPSLSLSVFCLCCPLCLSSRLFLCRHPCLCLCPSFLFLSLLFFCLPRSVSLGLSPSQSLSVSLCVSVSVCVSPSPALCLCSSSLSLAVLPSLPPSVCSCPGPDPSL